MPFAWRGWVHFFNSTCFSIARRSIAARHSARATNPKGLCLGVVTHRIRASETTITLESSVRPFIIGAVIGFLGAGIFIQACVNGRLDFSLDGVLRGSMVALLTVCLASYFVLNGWWGRKWAPKVNLDQKDNIVHITMLGSEMPKLLVFPLVRTRSKSWGIWRPVLMEETFSLDELWIVQLCIWRETTRIDSTKQGELILVRQMAADKFVRYCIERKRGTCSLRRHAQKFSARLNVPLCVCDSGNLSR